MSKIQGTVVAAMFVVVVGAGCGADPTPPAETPATNGANDESAVVEATPEPADREDLPVAEDFEEEVEKGIVAGNYVKQLDGLEKEILGDGE